jgi:NAD(P)-dependent dehydrogenase (short-subunit alcohol dehydrogenase family)
LTALSVDLSTKVAFVTGASSGIGQHFASLLARNGASVVLAARRLDALNCLAEDIQSAGGTALPVALDVRSNSSIAAAVQIAFDQFGRIDILVNNSGIAITKPALEQSAEDWDSVLDTNLRGAFFTATEIARRQRAASQGASIINVASILGSRQAGRLSPYAVSKAGLIQMTKMLALELARYSIRVNAIAPGYIEVERSRDFFQTDAGRALISRIPQRRLGTPADLDGVLLLLASDASKYMTGAVIAVDGGHLTSTL